MGRISKMRVMGVLFTVEGRRIFRDGVYTIINGRDQNEKMAVAYKPEIDIVTFVQQDPGHEAVTIEQFEAGKLRNRGSALEYREDPIRRTIIFPLTKEGEGTPEFKDYKTKLQRRGKWQH